MKMPATRKPTTGEVTRARTWRPREDHCTPGKPPAAAIPAPTRPPISACELDDGMPSRLVMTCQVIAPVSAPKMMRASTMFASTMPRPTVSATCRPNTRKAMKLKNAAQATA